MPEGVGYGPGGEDPLAMVGDMLEGLGGALAQGGAPKEAADIVAQMQALFTQLQGILGGGEAPPQEVAAAGGSPEAAGNPGAVPVR